MNLSIYKCTPKMVITKTQIIIIQINEVRETKALSIIILIKDNSPYNFLDRRGFRSE